MPWIFQPTPFLRQTCLELLQYIQTLINYLSIHIYFFQPHEPNLPYILFSYIFFMVHFVLHIILCPFSIFPLSWIDTFVHDTYIIYLNFHFTPLPLLLFFYIFINRYNNLHTVNIHMI